MLKAGFIEVLKTGISALLLFTGFLFLYIADRHIIDARIVFYDGLICLGFTVFFYVLIWVVFVTRRGSSPSSWHAGRIPLAILIFALLGYAFIITIPSLLDRSISLYILSSVEAAGSNGATKPQIEDWFYRGFIERNDAVGKRLHEQIVTGNISYEGNSYHLTHNGMMTYKIYRGLVGLFNTDPRYVIPINGAKSRSR